MPLITIPTTSGTGAEITPFAVIRDGKTNKKYPLADYCMVPQCSIIDPSFTYTMPKSLVAFTGYDALTHAVEAYVSVLASEFTKPLALRSIQLLHKHLIRSYETGEREARRNVHYASTMAGYAFGNSFVGVAHSIAHQLGGRYDIPHGVACAIALPEVVRFNATDAPTRQGMFPQYKFPNAKAAYAEIADAIGLAGNTPEEKVEALYQELLLIRNKLNIVGSIKETGKATEESFLLEVHALARQSFDDQCTVSESCI